MPPAPEQPAQQPGGWTPPQGGVDGGAQGGQPGM
jgi:hypothetical protein